jgi:hypothetical protein
MRLPADTLTVRKTASPPTVYSARPTGGNSWTKIWDGSLTTNGSYSVASFGGNLGDRPDGERLAVDPANRNVLYVGTKNDGLWQSMNRHGQFSHSCKADECTDRIRE